MPLNERNGNQTKCTILIVENDDDIRAGLRREVEQLGHRITVVSQRDEASWSRAKRISISSSAI